MKYQAYRPIILENRKWPEKQIIDTPQWCSVDLRDGNQALSKPMDLEKKYYFFSF